MRNVLLHGCCAPCLTSAIYQLYNDNVIPCWYNPNIEPESEHEKRYNAFAKLSKLLSIDKSKLEYDYQTENKLWHNAIAGYENEIEGGKRCEKCIEFRLKKVAEYLKKDQNLATSLTVSPHKNAEMINKIGKNISAKYLESNFKKNDGYKISQELSKKYDLYRQNYCGCLYSRKIK